MNRPLGSLVLLIGAGIASPVAAEDSLLDLLLSPLVSPAQAATTTAPVAVARTSAAPKVTFAFDDMRSTAGGWIGALLVDAKLNPQSLFIGKFFGEADEIGVVKGTIIAPSEAFRDEQGAWDRFDLTIRVNYDPAGDIPKTGRSLLVSVENYRFRHRSLGAVPSPGWDYWSVSDGDVRMQQIVQSLGRVIKRLSGTQVGAIVLSPAAKRTNTPG